MKNYGTLQRALAVVALTALAACAGGASVGPNVQPSGPVAPITLPPPGAGLTGRIVGVGDSLTAGEQSNGLLGVNATFPASGYPGHLVFAGQYNGWWSLFYEQATGTTQAQMATPSSSVLPLIAAPGLGSQLVITPAGPPYFGFPTGTHLSCDTFNNSAYSASTAASTRANPGAINYDVAIPGITAHEALTMTAPLSLPNLPTGGPPPTTCTSQLPGSLALLNEAVNSESNYFYPVLSSFIGKVSPLTEINAAVAMRPTLATVWLGANDLLHYSFSAGQFGGVDTGAQMQTDVTTAIQKLQATGAKVVVANLPSVLQTAQFFQGGIPPATLSSGVPTCEVQNYFFCGLVGALELVGIPAANAQTFAGQAVAGVQTNNSVGANGYATLSGFFCAVQEMIPQIQGGATQVTVNLDGCSGGAPVAGSGMGTDYLTDGFAGQLASLNAAYNTSIAAAATATGAPLVDIQSIIAGIYSGTGPYFAMAASIHPGVCCTLVYGGGLFSLDGLHPSNTGYALIANAWIGTVDTGLSGTIPTLTTAQIQAINTTDPYQ